MLRSARFAGWASVGGAAIGVLITPFMATVWAYEAGIEWADQPLLERAFGPTLESWGALTFGPADFPYEVYGKAFVFVYLLMLPIVRYVLALHSDESKWEHRIWRALWFALVVATIGDGVSYWGISAPGPVGQFLWRAGFMVEVLAMMVVLAATTMFGVSSLRRRVIPRWTAGLLTTVLPVGVATLTLVTTYVPNAVVVPMSIIWAMVGVRVLIRHAQPPVVDSESVVNRSGARVIGQPSGFCR